MGLYPAVVQFERRSRVTEPEQKRAISCATHAGFAKTGESLRFARLVEAGHTLQEGQRQRERETERERERPTPAQLPGSA